MPSERRLHPLSVLFAVASALRSLLLPMLFVLFADRSRLELWFALLLFPYLLAAFVRYIRYRYVLTGDELVIKTGLVFRNERHIRFSRIHNIAAVQTPLHRLFGVAEVRVETAGGSEPEARMRVLSLAAREEMRRHIFAEKEAQGAATDVAPAAVPRPADGSSVLHLPTRELLLHGVIDNRGMVVVGAAVGLTYEAGLFSEDRLPGARFLQSAGDSLDAAGGSIAWVAAVAALAIGFLVLLRLFSIGWAIVTLYGFDVRSNGKELRTTYGLLTRNTSTIPIHRIQLLSIRERPLQRLLGRLEVQVDTAGGNPAEAAGQRRPKLAPLLRKAGLGRFLGHVQPGVDLEAVPWRPVHPAARRRIFRLSSLGALLATLAAVGAFGPWGALLLPPLLILAGTNAALQSRTRFWAVSTDAVLYRKGWMWRRLSLARTAKIQALSLSQSPFDRRWGMATLQVDTAGGRPGGSRLRMRFLEIATARRLLDVLGARAAETAFHW